MKWDSPAGQETKRTQESDNQQPRSQAEALAGGMKGPWQTQWTAVGTTTWLHNLLQPSQHNCQVGSCCKTQTICTRRESKRYRPLKCYIKEAVAPLHPGKSHSTRRGRKISKRLPFTQIHGCGNSTNADHGSGSFLPKILTQ